MTAKKEVFKVKKRGRPPKQKELKNAKEKKTGAARSFSGKYDVYDKRTVELLDRKQKIFFIASLGGTQSDCARYAGITQGTLTQCYREEYYAGKTDLKMRIRCAQLAKALEGDPSLLKHLGVSHCEEQKDNSTTDLTKEELKGGIEALAAGAFSEPQEE